ncbi:MAG: hypothetical protein LBV34_14320, partial [Nocardiopsaceae bacterium]|nr:hypothetical protein [Nocardiopsaceae bacterium]
IPGASATEARATALSRLGPYLLTLSDGETGLRARWIGASIGNLPGNPDVELSGGGQLDFSSYDNVPQFRIRDGATLSAENLEACLPYEAAFIDSFPLFLKLREKYMRPDLAFQVGIPAPLDLSVDAFGFEAGFEPRYYQPSYDATASQVAKIAAAARDDVVFQIETPAALIAVASGDDAAAKPTAQHVAGLTVQLPAAVPAGTRFGVHLCLGDMNHKAVVGMRDIGPAVLVANEVAAAWPADRPLEFMHMPFAAADEPPSFDPAFYAPLRELSIPSSVRFVAGCIHESLSADQQVELLRLIETHVGREVDVAAACGLGRRPDVSQAWDAIEKALLLVEQTPA